MNSLALGVPLTMVTVLGLLLNGYIMLVVVLTKQVHSLLVVLWLSVVSLIIVSCSLLFSSASLQLSSLTFLSDAGSLVLDLPF
jgi:hypothetical protein